MDRSQRLRHLRRIIGSGHEAAPPPRPPASTGLDGLDRALGGGIARGQLHELLAEAPEHAAAALAMAAILGRNLGGALVWLREEAAECRLRLHGPGLAQIGCDPGGLLLATLPDSDAVLRAGADVLRCPDAGVAVIELWRNPRKLDLTATRRFQLAAEASGVTALLLRIDAEPAPGAATTRLAVRSLAARPLGGNAPGFPAFELELLRHRGGGRGLWRAEWDRDSGRFSAIGDAALSGAALPASSDGAAADILPLRRAG